MVIIGINENNAKHKRCVETIMMIVQIMIGVRTLAHILPGMQLQHNTTRQHVCISQTNEVNCLQ